MVQVIRNPYSLHGYYVNFNSLNNYILKIKFEVPTFENWVGVSESVDRIVVATGIL